MNEINDEIPQKNSDHPSQRRLLLGVGTVAALVGVGAASWLGQRSVPEPSAGGVEAVPGLWSQVWETPQGTNLPMAGFRGRPLLINFWATWCPPCVEELPLINAFYNQNKANGWQVLGLAVDRLSAVQSFLGKMPLDFPVGLAGVSGADLGRELGNLTGGLPFSVALGADGAIAQRKLGRLHAEDLTLWAGLK